MQHSLHGQSIQSNLDAGIPLYDIHCNDTWDWYAGLQFQYEPEKRCGNQSDYVNWQTL